MPRGRAKLVLAVVGVLATLVAIGALTGDDSDDGDGRGGGDNDVAVLSKAATAAGCGPIERTTPLPKAPKHRAGAIEYAEAPPNSGDHSGNTLRNAKRFYSRDDNPAVEQAVHNLEHGLVVAWYDDELPDDEVATLSDISQRMGSRFVAVPWRRSAFRDGRHFALTAWGKTLRCERVSAEVVEQFIEDHADSEDAPEAGYSV